MQPADFRERMIQGRDFAGRRKTKKEKKRKAREHHVQAALPTMAEARADHGVEAA